MLTFLAVLALTNLVVAILEEERRLSRQALVLSERRLTEMVDNLPGGVIHVDGKRADGQYRRGGNHRVCQGRNASDGRVVPTTPHAGTARKLAEA